MGNNKSDIEQCLHGIVIKNLQDFVDTLNLISPLIDGWGIVQPLSADDVAFFGRLHIRRKAYVRFSIPKRSGGERIISAPVGRLKQIQAALNLLLQTIFTPSDYATGFVAGRSIRNNADRHTGQTCICNIDLENFFPSITKDMLRKALCRELAGKIRSRSVINLICDLCTMPETDRSEVLPQGAPTSPVLSNIVLNSFDREMALLATRIGCRYSRYADDMTFSHHRSIRRMIPTWMFEISRIVEKHGLKINGAKTKTLVKGQRMEVTGVVVSDKINVPRRFIKQLRTLLQLWEKYGYDRASRIYVDQFCHGAQKDLSNVVRGKINYLEMIKGKHSRAVGVYRHRFNALQWHRKHDPKVL